MTQQHLHMRVVRATLPPATQKKRNGGVSGLQAWLCLYAIVFIALGSQLDALGLLSRESASFHKGGKTRMGSCSVGADREPDTLLIPKILHHIYIGDRMPADYFPWMESCLYAYNKYSGWKHMFWDEASARELVARVDPSYLQTYDSFTIPVQQADLVRLYLMKHYGGLYLDNDTECFKDGSDMLAGYHVVLQGHGPTGAANGMMASIPGHPIWDEAIRILKQRQGLTRYVYDTLETTGPRVVRDAYLSIFNTTIGPEDELPDYATLSGGCVRVYQIGFWFIPCIHINLECAHNIMMQRAVGKLNLEDIAGMHRYHTSWAPHGISSAYPTTPESFISSVCSSNSSRHHA